MIDATRLVPPGGCWPESFLVPAKARSFVCAVLVLANCRPGQCQRQDGLPPGPMQPCEDSTAANGWSAAIVAPNSSEPGVARQLHPVLRRSHMATNSSISGRDASTFPPPRLRRDHFLRSPKSFVPGRHGLATGGYTRKSRWALGVDRDRLFSHETSRVVCN